MNSMSKRAEEIGRARYSLNSYEVSWLHRALGSSSKMSLQFSHFLERRYMEHTERVKQTTGEVT